MKYLLVAFLLISSATWSCAKDEKSDKRLKAAIDKEELRFRKNMEKHPDDAEVYREHANNLLEFNSEYQRAQVFYKKALELDSTNSAIYRDYGRYLFERLFALDDAKAALIRGLQYSADDEEAKKSLASVNAAIVARDEEVRLKDFGRVYIKELNPNGNYAAMSNLDSLKKVLAEPNSDKNYRQLLKRFLADDNTLTPADMYLLMIGYAREPDYNPFNYNDILALRQLARFNIDSAISKGIELTGTNPLNPSLNRELMYYCRKKGDTVTANKYKNRIHLFFDGMLYSGNGTCDRPYLSLWSKEYSNFSSYIGYKPTDNHSMGNCAGQMAEFSDMINMATGKTESICFNLRLIYLQTTRK